MGIKVLNDQIDPPSNIFVLFNAFETLCFPQCITDTSQVYSSSVDVRKSCKYIILLSGWTRHASERVLLRVKHNNSE